MLYLVYFVISFGATLIGSIVGLGGGIIIKPVLDNLNNFSTESITFLSTVTVFFMALVTTMLNQKKGMKPINLKSMYLIIGSIIGGIVGSSLFSRLVNDLPNEQLVAKIQALLVIIMLVIVLLAKRLNFKKGIKQKKVNFVLSGFLMGLIASFLGIGGGPINMAILLLGFNFNIKQAAVISTVTILFAQVGSIVTTLMTKNILDYDIQMLIVMIPAGIIGGFVGSKLTSIITHEKIDLLFVITLLGIIVLNLKTILF